MSNQPPSAPAAPKAPTAEYKPTTEIQPPDMRSDRIKKKFPWYDRLSLALNCCRAKEDPSVLLNKQEALFKFEEEFKEPRHQELGLRLDIKETGSLLLDPHVLHPFVKVHMMDMTTSKYLAKKDATKPGAYNRESISLLNSKGEITAKPTDFFLPVATKMYDMRIKGQNQCCWNEQFFINEFASHILKPSTVFLFEILECNTSLIQQGSALLNAEMMYPVAWGYLRPVGTAHIHMSRTRIQLYKYKMSKQETGMADHRTPNVFLEFNWPKKQKYPSYLEVNLSFCGKSEDIVPR